MSPRSVGDSEGGFAVAPLDSNAVVRVRAWGFWPPAVANALVDSVFEAFPMGRKPAQIMIDAVALKPQRDEGQAAFAEMFDRLAKLGGVRVDIVVASPLTKLQLARITKAGDRKSFVELKGAEVA